MIVRRAGLAALLLVLAATAFARGATVAVEARVVPYVFAPSAVTVAVGDTVVWTMLGEPHTVTSGTIDGNNVGHPDGRFDSGTKLVGEQYSRTFNEPGTFPYFCIVHADSQMKGTITVTAATTPAPTAAPTPAPTPRPTPRPTAQPATPAPTPAPTPSPTPSPQPTASPSPSPTAEPTASASPTATSAPSSGSPSPSADPTDPPDPAGAADGLSIALIAGAVVALAAGGGWWLLRRR